MSRKVYGRCMPWRSWSTRCWGVMTGMLCGGASITTRHQDVRHDKEPSAGGDGSTAVTTEEAAPVATTSQASTLRGPSARKARTYLSSMRATYMSWSAARISSLLWLWMPARRRSADRSLMAPRTSSPHVNAWSQKMDGMPACVWFVNEDELADTNE